MMKAPVKIVKGYKVFVTYDRKGREIVTAYPTRKAHA